MMKLPTDVRFQVLTVMSMKMHVFRDADTSDEVTASITGLIIEAVSSS
jgi:hypothetical protein